LIGPVPCYYQQIAGLWRWQIILRAAAPQRMIPDILPDGWSVDIDPVTLL